MKKKNDCPKSRAMTEEFLDYFPVAHSNMRIKVSAQNYRMFIDHGEGSRLYDIDGNEYIDFLTDLLHWVPNTKNSQKH